VTEEEIAAAAAAAAAEKAKTDKAAADKAAIDKAASDAAAAAAAATAGDSDALKAEIAKLRADAKAAKDQADATAARFKGIDPEAARKALEAAAALEEKALIEKGEFDRVRQTIVDAADARAAELEAQIAALNGKVAEKDKTLDNLTVGQNFTTSAFIAEKLVLTPSKTRALYGSHFQLEDGVTVAYDKPAGSPGRTKYLDAKGLPLGFEAAIEKIIAADPEAEYMMKSTMKPGAKSKTDDKSADEKPATTGVNKILAGLRALQA
jgi:hypothetical protein